MFAHVFIIYMYFLGMRAMHIILAIKCPLPTCYICIDVPLLQHQTSCGHVINIYVYMSRNAGQNYNEKVMNLK